MSKCSVSPAVAGRYLLSAIMAWGVMTLSVQAKSPPESSSGVVHANIKQSKETPHEINYQGWLGDPSDTTNTGITDVLGMWFRLYTTPAGGTSVWDEAHIAVSVNKGIFNVLLGSATPIPSDIFTGDPLWLETQVSTDTLSPRKKLVSVGYAMKSEESDHSVHSDTADYASSSAPDNDWTVSGSNLYAQDTSWNVGIGTTTPSANARLFANANGESYGIYGQGSTGKMAGVCGSANGAWHGVFARGFPDKRSGVYGDANGADYGIYGIGHPGKIAGVYGDANSASYGIYGRGSTDKFSGVYGKANGADYGVYSSGNLGCSGTKPAVVRTSKGPTEMYCVEATELWFEDFGAGRLTNGQAQIDLARDFLETVTIDADNPMKVFIQLANDCNGVYVKKGLTGFEIIELGSGTSNAGFDYRIVAKRKHYETQRMKVVESCYTDKLLYANDNDPTIPAEWREVRREQSNAETSAKEAAVDATK